MESLQYVNGCYQEIQEPVEERREVFLSRITHSIHITESGMTSHVLCKTTIPTIEKTALYPRWLWWWYDTRCMITVNGTIRVFGVVSCVCSFFVHLFLSRHSLSVFVTNTFPSIFFPDSKTSTKSQATITTTACNLLTSRWHGILHRYFSWSSSPDTTLYNINRQHIGSSNND